MLRLNVKRPGAQTSSRPFSLVGGNTLNRLNAGRSFRQKKGPGARNGSRPLPGGIGGQFRSALDACENPGQSKRPGARYGSRPLPGGWAGWIRTSGMTESKSVALPLGDSPIFCCIVPQTGIPYSGRYEKKAKCLFFLYGVDSRIRTDGLQSHNLAL